MVSFALDVSLYFLYKYKWVISKIPQLHMSPLQLHAVLPLSLSEGVPDLWRRFLFFLVAWQSDFLNLFLSRTYDALSVCCPAGIPSLSMTLALLAAPLWK
jgi:hypothetical protein